MARRPRVVAPQALYHVIVRGNHRQAIFLNDTDYQAYLSRLEKYRHQYQVCLWAYCLMPNHVHLLLETGGPPLAKFMQGIQQSYTQYFNRTHAKVGHLFQGRYKAILCEKERYLLALIRYIHLNPVRAQLVTQPEAYAYSSHQAYLGATPPTVLDPEPGLALFGGRQTYLGFIHEGLGEGHQAAYYAVTDQQFLGTESFRTRWQAQASKMPAPKPASALPHALHVVAAALAITPAVLRSADRSWAVSHQRTLCAYVLVRRQGFRVGDVAMALGRDAATLSVLLSRYAAALPHKLDWQRQMERVARKVKK